MVGVGRSHPICRNCHHLRVTHAGEGATGRTPPCVAMISHMATTATGVVVTYPGLCTCPGFESIDEPNYSAPNGGNTSGPSY